MLPDWRRRSRDPTAAVSRARPPHDEAGDDELVHEVDDGGQGALDAPDQHLVIEPVNVEAVGEGAGDGIAGELVGGGEPA